MDVNETANKMLSDIRELVVAVFDAENTVGIDILELLDNNEVSVIDRIYNMNNFVVSAELPCMIFAMSGSSDPTNKSVMDLIIGFADYMESQTKETLAAMDEARKAM